MITRSQIRRQLRSQGGIMNVVGRQKYGLGSFVKKAFGKAKDVVSDVVKSPIGKAALIAAGGYYLGGGNLFGLQRAGMSGFGMGNLPGIGGMFAKSGAAPFTNRFAQDLGMKQSTGILSSILGASKSNIAKVVGVGGLLGYFTSKGIAPEEAEQLSQDVYRGKGAGLDMIKADMEKYKSGESSESELFAKGYNFLPQKKFIRQGSADGGRIGLQSGGVSMSNTRAQNIAANQAQNQENQQMLEIGRARLPGARTAVQDYAMSDNSILGPLSKQAASTIMENQDKSQAALDVLNQTMTPTTDTGIMTQAPTISTPTPSVEKTTMADVAGPTYRPGFQDEFLTTGPSENKLFTDVVPDFDKYGNYTGDDQLIKDYAAAGRGTASSQLVKLPANHPYAVSGAGYYTYDGTNFSKTADENMTPEYEKFIRSNYGLASGGRAGYDMGGLSTIERAKALFEERDEAAPAPSPDMGSIKQLSNEDKAIMQQAIEAMSRDVGPMYSDPDGNEMTSKQFQDAMSRITELENMTMPKRKPSKSKGGMMSIPVRQNSGGITELDYRKSGGFVPVGIKEKADDVPAMLSKNEFVMTADAVRAAGGGSIEKGAQRMYNQMKQLEGKMA
jgi:hypothetical protein